jgi:hypothetical protein
MSSPADTSLKHTAETDAEIEHLFHERFRASLEHLQFAVTIACSQGVPLASACYRSSLADTIDELAAWFEREAAIHYRQKNKAVDREPR